MHASSTPSNTQASCTLDAFAVDLKASKIHALEESKGDISSQIMSESSYGAVQLLSGTALDENAETLSPYSILSQTDTAARIFDNTERRSVLSDPDRHAIPGFMRFDKASSSLNLKISQTGKYFH